MWLAAALIAGSCIVSAAAIELLLPLLRRYVLARPNPRSSHQRPTPQGGGIAVLAATVGTALVAYAMAGASYNAYVVALVFGGALLLCMVGLVDDIRPIAIAPRLLVQAVAVSMIVAALPGDMSLIPVLPGWVTKAILAIGAMWFVNLVNFMDGIDGMTVVETIPITAALAAFGAVGVLPADATVAALALCGAMLGFAPSNRPVARLFLGDAGSLPVGLLLAWMLILLAKTEPIAAVLLPLYYLADATLSLLRRAGRRQRIWEAHRDHFYQRAFDGGLSVNGVIGRVFVLNVTLAGLAFASATVQPHPVQLVLLAIGAALVALLLARFARPTKSLKT
jgi:UDP-N-acetylmuramyl pentapeptide phosphotransferase/UDP-N-acetylglucosamine-1-phosphate transferase